MKLRIKGNTIRFRLSQTEVDELAEGYVQDQTQFPVGKSLIYKIQSEDQFNVDFIEETVLVSIPYETIKIWASTDQIEINTSVQLDNSSQLEISIEKDFKCLTERPKEDESDLFPNPLEKHKNC